jgi:hypothetical protein
MGEQLPRPTVTPTGWRPVVAAALVGAGVGWLLFALPDRLGAPLPALPLVVTVTVVLLAGTCWALAIRTHRLVQVRRRQLDANRAVRLLAFAKASVLTGALLGGGYLAVALYSVQRWSADLPRERVVSSVIATVASVALAAAGGFLERSCRIPPSGDGDATPNRLPGGPPYGD